MIYRLQIKCVWGLYLEQPFVRTVEIDADTSLVELHDYIQQLTDFDNDHCFDFFVGRSPRDMRNSLGQRDDFAPASHKLKKIALANVFPLPKGQRLYYWFDFGDDWKFEISLKSQEEAKAGLKYPRVISEKGPKPVQYPDIEE